MRQGSPPPSERAERADDGSLHAYEEGITQMALMTLWYYAIGVAGLAG